MKKHLILVGVALAFVVAGALPALGHETPTPTPTAKPSPTPKVNLACMQAAIEKRDNAIIASVDKWHSTVSAGLKARQSALKDAWGKTDRKARREALKSAWSNWKKTSSEARKTQKTARNAAWKTFKTERNACGSGAFADDGTNEAIDINL